MDNWLDSHLDTDSVVIVVTEDTSTTRSVTREERIANCQKVWGGYFDPNHGKWRSVPYRCNIWRVCPLCLADRATTEHQKMDLVYEHGLPLRYIELPEDEADDLCNELGKSNFRRYPGTDTDRVFFISEDDDLGVEVDDDLLCGLDWKAVVFTPEGRKLSGSLGFVAPGAGSTSPKIKVECVMSDASPELRQQAVEWAIDQTKKLNPKTMDELTTAISIRTHEYKSYLVANEATLYPSRSVAVSVDVGSLDWQVAGYMVEGGKIE